MTLRIVSGAMQPGEKIPSVRELAVTFGVNPNTMQRAMAEMEREGLVYTERTSGRFLTKEEGVLVEKRNLLAQEETEKYLAYMYQIGFTQEEILNYLRMAQQKGEKAE
ncbi:MAG TPA: GntR family transcriptional regulator [Candidatus Anaerotignum merdipullorum]|nr:GntR family transcriptional regulator [Candidatus Anaerotignum merdipullorum]